MSANNLVRTYYISGDLLRTYQVLSQLHLKPYEVGTIFIL